MSDEIDDEAPEEGPVHAAYELLHGGHETIEGAREMGHRGHRVDGGLTAAGGIHAMLSGANGLRHVLANNVAARAAQAALDSPTSRSAAQTALHAADRAEQIEHVGRGLSIAGGVISTATGLYNLNQARQNWHQDPDRAEAQANRGATSLLGGGATLGGLALAGAGGTLGMVGTALPGLGTGIALGTAGLAHANSYARDTALYGQSQFTRHRGVGPAQPGEIDNRDTTDAASDAGLDVRRRVGHGALGTVAGALTSMALSPFTAAFSLATQAGLAAPNTGTGDIEAADAEERGAPLNRSDQSQLAERRRQIRARRAAQAAATNATHAQLQQNIAAEGHHDTTMNTTGRFVPINASGNSVERAALGMAPAMTDDDLARMLQATP